MIFLIPLVFVLYLWAIGAFEGTTMNNTTKAYTLAIMALLGVRAQAAPLAPYADLPTAVAAGLEDAAALAPGFEAGGAVYQCSGSFAYTPVVTDGKRDRVSVPTGAAPGCTLAAVFHTHPKGDARFSTDDVRATCKLHTVAYILPRDGAPVSFDCSTLSPAAVKAVIERTERGLPI